MGYTQAMARLRRAIAKVAAGEPVVIVREVFGDVAYSPLTPSARALTTDLSRSG
jgi:hypothetical protein